METCQSNELGWTLKMNTLSAMSPAVGAAPFRTSFLFQHRGNRGATTLQCFPISRIYGQKQSVKRCLRISLPIRNLCSVPTTHHVPVSSSLAPDCNRQASVIRTLRSTSVPCATKKFIWCGNLTPILTNIITGTENCAINSAHFYFMFAFVPHCLPYLSSVHICLFFRGHESKDARFEALMDCGIFGDDSRFQLSWFLWEVTFVSLISLGVIKVHGQYESWRKRMARSKFLQMCSGYFSLLVRFVNWGAADTKDTSSGASATEGKSECTHHHHHTTDAPKTQQQQQQAQPTFDVVVGRVLADPILMEYLCGMLS